MKSMKINTTYGLGLLLLGSFSACIDQIPIGFSEDPTEYLIVNAELRDNEIKHVIELKLNSTEAQDFQANFPIENAEVYVIQDSSKKIEFKLRQKGKYVSINLDFDEGSSYVLHINYKGISYMSKIETYQKSLPIKDLKTVLTIENKQNAANNSTKTNYVNLLLDTDFSTDEHVYLKYRVSGTYAFKELVTALDFDPAVCYINEIIDFDNISIASNSSLKQENIRSHPIIKKAVDHRFAFNYCMKVYQDRISENAFAFWKLVANEYSRTGDIFEKPPGIIRGNILELEDTNTPVIGLFSIMSVDSLSHLIGPGDVDFPDGTCGRYGNLPATCLNCLLLNKSSLIVPECFQ